MGRKSRHILFHIRIEKAVFADAAAVYDHRNFPGNPAENQLYLGACCLHTAASRGLLSHPCLFQIPVPCGADDSGLGRVWVLCTDSRTSQEQILRQIARGLLNAQAQSHGDQGRRVQSQS